MFSKFMLIGITITVVVFGVGAMYVVFANADSMMNQNNGMEKMMQSMMGGGKIMGDGGMTCTMNDIPQDVIIKIKSSQQVYSGKDSTLKLLVLDKNTHKPLTDAKVIVGIERGAPMSTMDMMGSMFNADNLGDGQYLVRFTLDTPGYYTLHTHVVLAGKSMHSMMDNHMDIGIVVVK